MNEIRVRDLGRRPLAAVWADMRDFTDRRDEASGDEIWFVEHPPVFTLGLNADSGHLLEDSDIEVVRIDRGGQVTYHGPGQLVCYVLLNIKRLGLGVRALVETLESAVIDTVASYGVEACARRDAPGVYVGGRKLAAVGLRIRRGCSYHGIAVNLEMDLAPFKRIRPCGLDDVEVTQLSDLCGIAGPTRFRADFEQRLLDRLAA